MFHQIFFYFFNNKNLRLEHYISIFFYLKKVNLKETNLSNKKCLIFNAPYHNVVKKNKKLLYKILKNAETLKINFTTSKRFFINKKIDPYIIHYALRVYKLLFIKI